MGIMTEAEACLCASVCVRGAAGRTDREDRGEETEFRPDPRAALMLQPQ